MIRDVNALLQSLIAGAFNWGTTALGAAIVFLYWNPKSKKLLGMTWISDYALFLYCLKNVARAWLTALLCPCIIFVAVATHWPGSERNEASMNFMNRSEIEES